MSIIWIVLLVIVFFVIRATKDKNNRATRQSGNISSRNINYNSFSIKVDIPRVYSSILNDLEVIVSSVVNASYCEVNVVVQVRKIDNVYCSVACSLLADTSFSGVVFGEGFLVDGNDHARCETVLATGFTTPDDVKREILLQFNWSNISVSNTQVTVLDYGDYINTPYISYSFTAMKK